MFPLKQRKLIRGCLAHVKAGLGCAADYVASIGTALSVSHTGTAYEPYWYKLGLGQGGWWAGIKRPNGDRIEFAHLNKKMTVKGAIKEGDAFGVTGNTGTITDYPHLHVQIFDKFGRRLDPEQYDWEDGITDEEIKQLYYVVWKREPAYGDWYYFRKRLELGTIKDYADLKVKMAYTYAQYQKLGDAWWQAEKKKVLG